MKIRNGFVSNSSSSSFIVVFDKKPSSQEELQKLLFGDEEYFYGPYDGRWSAETVAAEVWSDLKKQSPMTVKELADNMHGSNNVPYPDHIYRLEDEKLRDRLYSLHYSLCDAEDQRLAEEFAKEAGSKEIYYFSYSDNDGSLQADMEHGDLFSRLKHVRINNH